MANTAAENGATPPEVLYEVDGPAAVITLNRPDQLNAWTAAMAAGFADAVGRADADPDVIGIVVTGAGRGFCAGADLSLLSGLTSSQSADAASKANRDDDDARDTGAAGILSGGVAPGDPQADAGLRGTYSYLMSVGKPVVAAINGAVAGMGLPIALACDLRFIADDAVVTTAFAHRGLIAEWGLSWLLTRTVGPAHALDLLYSARKINGTEAARLGLANRALPRDEVLTAAVDYIAALAAHSSPTSLAVMKRQVYDDLHRSLDASLRASRQLMLDSFGRPDFAEGVQSFLQRRPPQFPPVDRAVDLGSTVDVDRGVDGSPGR